MGVGRGEELSGREARAMAIAAQGLARDRPAGPIGRRHLRALMGTVGTIQLDAINVLQRTQFLVPFSRLGPYELRHLHAMNGPGGELLEYWGHAASLLEMDMHPLLRWRMATTGPWSESPKYAEVQRAWYEAHADYIAAVKAEVAERGPLTAGQLSDPRRRDGEWWDRRSVGRQAFELLFLRGELAAWRTPNFERVYDLPERVIPAAILQAPTPPVEDAHRSLLLAAAGSLGVATAKDLADYYRIKVRRATPRVAELVEEGSLVRTSVEGWSEPAYVLPGARPARLRRQGATVLSPFDSLVWDRARTRRLFDFDYTIEVYTPAPKRRFGYYVLPILLGDALVGRLDLKADRTASTLLVNAAHLEAGHDAATVAAPTVAELHLLREWLGLGGLEVAASGDLAPALRRASGAGSRATVSSDPRRS
jgi:uncharacterized protein YcaQ